MGQTDIEKRLRALGDVIAGRLKPDYPASTMTVEVLKTSTRASAVKVSVGDKSGFVKIFATGQTAKAAFEREHRALALMNAAQVPRLLFVAIPQRLILTGFVAGKTLDATLDGETMIMRAEHLGQWFGQLSAKVASVDRDESWADYLAKYQTGFDQNLLKQQARILRQTSIKKLTLAHNDNALSNFILGPDKRLYAVDFEDCRMKPEGWDLVTATAAIFCHFPLELQTISASVLRGYRLTAPECGLPDNFDQVINALTLSIALARPSVQ